MKSSAAKIQMTGFQDLFQVNGEAEANGERVQEISLAELFPFKDHPFQVRDDEAMRETADSIAKYGVLVPGIVRSRLEGSYEIVTELVTGASAGVSWPERGPCRCWSGRWTMVKQPLLWSIPTSSGRKLFPVRRRLLIK